MAEYVEREAVANALVEKGQKSTRYKIGDFWELNWNEIKEVLDSIPSADVQPVKHGKWVYENNADMFWCSECQGLSIRNDYPFCHWCGADMRGET